LFHAILYHISTYFSRIFGVYAVRILFLKMPHKTDMPSWCTVRVDADAQKAIEPEPYRYYEVDDAEIDLHANSADVRAQTGFRYFGTGSAVDVTGLVPDDATILARQQQLLDEMSEFPSVKVLNSPTYCT